MANVDLKSLFTSEKQYTVLQLLNVLIDEVGKSMVKTATINQDVSAGTLTITVTLSDDSVVTASTKLNSLTDAEKSLISTLQSQVTAISDGITFTKFVGFEGNETHKGNEIHQGYESHLGDESHAGSEMHKGTATFTDLRSDDLTATDGQELVSWDGTTTALKGKADRPTYNGGDLALKSDKPYNKIAIGYVYKRAGSYDAVNWNGIAYYNDDYLNIDVVIATAGIGTDSWFGIYINATDTDVTNLGNLLTDNGVLLKNDTANYPFLGGVEIQCVNVDQELINAHSFLYKDYTQTGFFIDAKSFDANSTKNQLITLHVRLPLVTKPA